MSSARAAEQKMGISRIMTDERMNYRGKKIAAWNYVLSRELLSGTQFLVAKGTNQLYAVVSSSGPTRVMPLPNKSPDRWNSYFNTYYGLTKNEDFRTFIYDSLRDYVIEHGTRVEVRRFVVYDTARQNVYMSAYNGRMYRVDPEHVDDMSIGEDGIFFVDDDPGRHDLPDIGDHGVLFDRLINTINFTPQGMGGITAEQQRRALIVWLFALAFPDLLPAKPILLLEGAYGSGKSSVVMLIQMALSGDQNPTILQRNKEDDFGVILQRSPITLLDNLDSYIDWMPDAVAAYTTSGSWNKRKLYTDDENMIIKPHAFIAVATRNPASFRREDVADRCVILRLERRTGFMNESELRAQILAERPQLLGEYLWYVQRIVQGLRDAQVEQRQETYRMAGFAAFGRVVGKVLGWAAEDVDALFQALQNERNAFIREEDPLAQLLTEWIDYKRRNGPSNIGRVVTAATLHAELTAFAQIKSMTWNDSPRTLVQKMKSSSVESLFRVDKTAVQGQIAFRIWRHSDTQLTLVGEEKTE